jgi:DNA-3-methyladenine glycosylase II
MGLEVNLVSPGVESDLRPKTSDQHQFAYSWQKGVEYLKEKDSILKPILLSYHGERLQPSPDAFTTLTNAIIGQQISVHAAEAVWTRLVQRFGNSKRLLQPYRIFLASDEELKACGLSKQKIVTLRGICQAFLDGALAFSDWMSQDDETIFHTLIKLRGIGPWTAHMFMIFHLGRLDILPKEDLGLIKSYQVVYSMKNLDRRTLIQHLIEHAQIYWKPFRTVATWYLWRVLDPVVVAY